MNCIACVIECFLCLCLILRIRALASKLTTFHPTDCGKKENVHPFPFCEYNCWTCLIGNEYGMHMQISTAIKMLMVLCFYFHFLSTNTLPRVCVCAINGPHDNRFLTLILQT